MKKGLIILAIIGMSSIKAFAQDLAKYRITYDCNAQVITGKPQVFRWTLDIGDSTAVFYNDNYRKFNNKLNELQRSNDANVLLSQLPVLSKKYPGKNSMQILIGRPKKEKYIYINNVETATLQYKATMPAIDWQLTDSVQTICNYECRQAIGKVYGRIWAVWYCTELPLLYGPYILNGLPGLIMVAKDDEGFFNFEAAGIEQAPENTLIELININESQKCSRKRYLEMREEMEGLSYKELLERSIGQESSGKSKTIYNIKDEKGNDIADKIMPKYNYLDKE